MKVSLLANRKPFFSMSKLPAWNSSTLHSSMAAEKSEPWRQLQWRTSEVVSSLTSQPSQSLPQVQGSGPGLSELVDEVEKVVDGLTKVPPAQQVVQVKLDAGKVRT